MAEQGPGLFDKLYSAAKATYDELKKPVVRNKIKRKLQAAFDDASLKIGEATLKIQKTRESFDEYNVNTVLEQKAIITQALSLQTQIKEEYKELFAKEMTVEMD